METPENLNFLSALLPFAGIVFIIAVGVVLLTQQFRKNLYRQKLEQEELKNKHQQDLLRSSILVQEEERKRIAQDLHDELGATLSIARMHLMQLERQQNAKPEDRLEAIQNVRNLTETALGSMRRISHELMPPQLERFGLLKTLESVAELINSTSQLNIQLVCPNDLPELPWPIALGLYRINMELINNTIKHAGAGLIRIEFSCDKNSVTCSYKDNGKGMETDNPGKGLGHKSLEGRVNSLRGIFITGKSEDKGFTATITIPLHEL